MVRAKRRLGLTRDEGQRLGALTRLLGQPCASHAAPTAVLVVLVALVALGCGSSGPSSLAVDGDGYSVTMDARTGTFSVTVADGRTILENAFAEVEVLGVDGTAGTVYRTSDGYHRHLSSVSVTDALGTAQQIEARCTGLEGAPDLRLLLSAYEGRPYLTVAVEASLPGDGEVRVGRLVPAKVDAARGGALRLGVHPSTHRVLDDGSFFLFDFFVDVTPGDAPRPLETVALGMIHGQQQGHSISNWNHAIKDLATGRAFVAGALDFEHASPFFNTSYVADQAVLEGGRTPFSYWSAEMPFLPAGKPLTSGAPVTAGPVLIIPETRDPLGGLETYADAVKDWNGIRLWTERGSDHRVPTGWNSWTGSGGSGGYGSDIDQQLMLDNLHAMAEEFAAFGGEWFQIDDGYEHAYGDWDWRSDRFPDGQAWMAQQIAAEGLLPGLWIAPFQVDESSVTYATHEADGWFAPGLPLASGDKPILDLTRPDVLDWLTDRFQTHRASGYRWLKSDFMYYALGAAELSDDGATREEAYRRGLAAIRDGLAAGAAEAGGEEGDVFWVTVAMLGPHVGYVDSLRPNLDTMPAWDREQDGGDRRADQGFKPTVRVAARRYYWHNRVFHFNHDMIFFRAHPDPEVPPITADESRCLLTAIGLSGSVAKLGEKIVDMEPEWIQDFRRILPVFGHSARPLDLFERELPEVWHLHVVPAEGLNTGGDGPPYDVIALFNWGANRDLSVNPYVDMPDEAREVSIDLALLGLDRDAYVGREFWTGEVVTPVAGTLTRTVAPHTVELFALRPALERPQYVGGNRHLLQGAVEIRALAWDDATSTLALTYDAAPGSVKAPCEHRLDFHVPPGWSLLEADIPAAAAGSLGVATTGEVATVTFSVEQRVDAAVTLRFASP